MLQKKQKAAEKVLFSLRRVMLNAGGFEADGTYWGVGAPLWRYEAEFPPFWAHASWVTADQCESEVVTDANVLHTPENPNCAFHCQKCGRPVGKRYDRCVSQHLRAEDREHAVRKIQALYPEARFR